MANASSQHSSSDARSLIPPACAPPPRPARSIILENSGVAEPQNIRDQFNDAIADNHPLTKRVYLDTLVTGGRAFLTAFAGACASAADRGVGAPAHPARVPACACDGSVGRVVRVSAVGWLTASAVALSVQACAVTSTPSIADAPALPAVVDSHTFITDYSSRASLAARPDLGEGGSLRPVVDLLVEQIECVFNWFDVFAVSVAFLESGPAVHGGPAGGADRVRLLCFDLLYMSGSCSFIV